MTTFADLVNDVLLLMEGYGLEQDKAAFLTANVTATGLSLTVDSTENIGAGLAEIGDELVYVKSATGNTVTIAPDGRGYRGTKAAAHTTNARLTMSPILPRSLVKRKINETIVGVYPTLYGTASTTLTYDPVLVTYQIPSEVEEVLRVAYRDIGPSGEWPAARRWRFDATADTTSFPTGKTLSLWDGLGGVSDIRVLYRKQPSELTYDNDDLTDSGLQSTARAAIVAGAAWRLVSFMDASRLKVSVASMDSMDDRNPIGTSTQVGSYLRKQYERELEDEAARQQLLVKPTIHWQE